MNYFIRRLEKNDIKTLAGIMKNSFYYEPWNEIWDENKCFERLNIYSSISSACSFTLLNENNEICGAVIGYIIPFVDKLEYDLQEFFIDHNLQKNHLGTFLMNELLKELKVLNVDNVKFYTTGMLDKFYNKFGYKKVNDEYLMKLSINTNSDI